MSTVMDTAALQAFLNESFPQVAEDFVVRRIAPMELDLAMQVGQGNLRPGGTVSGPSMFALADVAVYLAILAMIGPVELAVTTSCSIDFMRKPSADHDLVARARLLKLGRSLAVGQVLLFSGGDDPVAAATLTYSIPPKKGV